MEIKKPPFEYEMFCSLMAAALPCLHSHQEIRQKVDSSGKPRLRRQCAECGRAMSGELKYASLEGRMPREAPRWDYGVENRFLDDYLALSLAVRTEMHKARSLDWWRRYGAYLRSEEWRAKSDACLDGAGPHMLILSCSTRDAGASCLL